ncbi:MAG: polyphosphate kinase 1 [Mangrovibacterium sp.]
MSDFKSYINREISWLAFNERVLQEATDPSVPLFERLRFIGIFSNNLDEFFRVRVAWVRRVVNYGMKADILGNYTAEQLYNEIYQTVSVHQKKSREIYNQLMKEMAQENIHVLNERTLTREQGVFVKRYFHSKVLPNLVPLMLDNKRKFPYLRDRSVYLAVKLSRSDKPDKFSYALVRIPNKTVGRFLVLPARGNKKYVILLDDIIRYCFADLFPLFKYDKFEAYTIKVTRDAELDIDEDISKSFIEKMELSLKKRKLGEPVRMLYDSEIPYDFLQFITDSMNIKSEDTVAGGRYHNHKDFTDFPEIGEPHHYYKSQTPVRHMALPPHGSILKKLRQRDVMLHYPYQSFGHFIDFLREAAIDPKVEEIGITIYRVASESRVVNALLNAIRNGKRVTVVIELKARFDEEPNIYWSNKLQEEGAHVINGVPGLKVHSKVAWVKRNEGRGYRNYAYIGTGNFHEGTARIYGDDGLLTADPRIANEIESLFEFYKHNYKNHNYKHIVVSPFNMRDFFTQMVEHEIKLAKSGQKAYMILKMNSLIDPDMIDKITEAASAGVKVQLVVRGIFGLKISDPKVAKNIEAISIVDKYLEHSRVFVFGNGGEARYYISSADWMPRNLNRRVEVACPIYDKGLQEELLTILNYQLQDNAKARVLDNSLTNDYHRDDNEPTCRSQEDIHDYIKDLHAVTLKIYHNPRCSKSRMALQFLEENGYVPEMVNYLKDGLTRAELNELMLKLDCSATELVRTSDNFYKENYANQTLSDEEWLEALVKNPMLLKRPIVVNGHQAVVASPPELIDSIL